MLSLLTTAPTFPTPATPASAHDISLLLGLAFFLGLVGIIGLILGITAEDSLLIGASTVALLAAIGFGFGGLTAPHDQPRLHDRQVAAVQTWLRADYGIHADKEWTNRLLDGQTVGAIVESHQVTIKVVHLPGDHVGLIDGSGRPLEPVTN